MAFLLSSGGFICGVSDCWSWIFVLLNFLSIFYLAFCVCYKINKVVKVIGYAWSGVVTVVSIVVIAIHTCLFTVFCAVFTGLMLFGLLYVINKNKVVIIKTVAETNPEPEKKESIADIEIALEKDESFAEEPYEEVELAPIEEVEEVQEVQEKEIVEEPEVVEEVKEEPEYVPETYILDDESGRVVEPEKNQPVQGTSIIAKQEEPKAQEPVQEIKKEEPVVEEIIVPVHNKFTDIVVSQIEGMPEMEAAEEKTREELVKELENRPVMVRFQQVTFNNNGDEKKTRVKTKKQEEKQEEKPVEKPKINRGYQIETFLND